MDEIKFTKPNRRSGFWDVENNEDGLEIYKARDNGTRRPICTMADPDLDEGGECIGNFALICSAPEMYRVILEQEKLLRFMILRSTTTEAERAEYRSGLCDIQNVLVNIGQYVKGLTIEANVDDDGETK